MEEKRDLVLIVTYAVFFLLIVLIAIVIFIIKSRNARIKVEQKKRETEAIAKQKTVLLKEIHHRVKNNLQLISGLLYLQSVKHKTPEVSAMIEESQKHINSIALVHEMLYKDDTLSLVSMKKYLEELGSQLLQVASDKEVEYKLNVENISLPVDYATTVGLILNELITNTLKHAFTTPNGTISVVLEKVNVDQYLFTYSDNGRGCNLNDQVNTTETLGQSLIKMFAEEIEADLTIKSEDGLTYAFRFKVRIK